MVGNVSRCFELVSVFDNVADIICCWLNEFVR